MRRIQLIVGVLVCIVLPGASYLDGTGRLAYTMFAEISEHRVEISIATAHGAFVLPPTRLARRAGATAGVFLAGSERFVPGPVHRTPRVQLGPLADLACVQARADGIDARRARVVLIERDDALSSERRYVAERTCGAGP